MSVPTVPLIGADPACLRWTDLEISLAFGLEPLLLRGFSFERAVFAHATIEAIQEGPNAEHRMGIRDVVTLLQSIIRSPVHALWLVRERVQHADASAETRSNLLGKVKPSVAPRFLLARVGEPIAVAASK
jgi:hypothetical protein